MPEDGVPDPVSEIDWLLRLALRITGGDVHAAEDLVQETLTLALERPPRSPSSLRGWLARVLRSRWLMGLRAEARRRDREEAVARRERAEVEAGTEHPLDVAERLARVRAAVRRLREPYRAAILLRYERGLAPREISSRLGVPLRTVETRLRRGLELLRRDVLASSRRDRRGRDERRPLGGLAAPFFPRRRAGGAAGSSVSVPAALAGGALLGGAGLAALALLAQGGAHGSSSPAVARAAAIAPADLALAAPAGARETRGLAQATGAPAAEPTPGAWIEGLVVDLAGAPVAGASVWLEAVHPGDGDHSSLRAERWSLAGGEDRVECGADGRFRLPFELGALPVCLRVSAETEEAATILGAYVFRGRVETDRTLVLAPVRDVEGTVLDEAGAPIAGALVRLRAPEDVASAVGHAPTRPAAFSATAHADDSGAFRFERVPLARGSRIEASRTGRLPGRATLGDVPNPIDVVLEPDPAVRVVSGRVVDRGGEPLERAYVIGGATFARTDRAGEFELALDAEDPPDELVAVAPGRFPARVPAPPAGIARALIVAGATARVLEGVVVDERGEPLANAAVWPLDLEVLGWEASRWPFASEVLAYRGDEMWYVNVVDGEGRFRIDGLADRDYRLRVASPEDFFAADVGPFRPGTSELVVRVDRTRAPGIRGVVRDRNGMPLEGISVDGLHEVRRVAHPDGGEPYVESTRAGEALTDAHGRFELPFAGSAPIRLQLRGPRIGTLERTLVEPGGGELELVVQERIRLEVQVEASLAADTLLVLDREGRPLSLVDANSIVIPWRGERAPVSPGLARVLLVPDDAAVARLLSEGETVLERMLPPPVDGPEDRRIELSLP